MEQCLHKHKIYAQSTIFGHFERINFDSFAVIFKRGRTNVDHETHFLIQASNSSVNTGIDNEVFPFFLFFLDTKQIHTIGI